MCTAQATHRLLAGARFRGFVLGFLALVPNLVLDVYFGYAGKRVARIVGPGSRASYAHDRTVSDGLIVILSVVVVVSRVAGRAVAEVLSTAAPERSITLP